MLVIMLYETGGLLPCKATWCATAEVIVIALVLRTYIKVDATLDKSSVIPYTTAALINNNSSISILYTSFDTRLPPKYRNPKHNNMKFAAVTLLFAALAIASPAPVAEPNTAAVAEFEDALSAREAAPAPEPEIVARTAGIVLDSRDPKKPKAPKNSNSTDTGAAGMLTPSRALELGALGLGAMMLWA
ncbi:hypothetical protein BDV96DRAFT_78275 [Lophiotrema nucula]|uniref:Uncharacterized protein n=1 Tax=Lophiotrema nucula TaxID=690887 RepID=A0A6A5Z808_9PLEO|nr:hypothetical protein BDV96DRAFT_78275 [Lophiotrema nucula]